MPPRRVSRVLWTAGLILVVVLGAAGLVVTAEAARFGQGIAAEARALWAVPGGPRRGAIDPSALPPPVARYAAASGALGRPPIGTVRLRHGGTFLVGGRWHPIRGVQYLAADPPGFVWWGRVRLAPGVWVDGRDESVAGEGSMRIVAASTWSLAELRGPELDQGALVRLLGELAWMPGALLDARYVRWSPVDDRSARARLEVGGRAVEATFHFGDDGLPDRFDSARYREVDGRGVLTPFTGRLGDYREVAGRRVPFRLEAAWTVDGHEQPYARWAVERLEPDLPEPYP